MIVSTKVEDFVINEINSVESATVRDILHDCHRTKLSGEWSMRHVDDLLKGRDVSDVCKALTIWSAIVQRASTFETGLLVRDCLDRFEKEFDRKHNVKHYTILFTTMLSIITLILWRIL